MKQLLTSILFLFYFIISAPAQFVVTPNGLMTTEAGEKDYYVIDVPGVSAADLYTKTIEYISNTFISPKDAISGSIENQLLTVTGIETIYYGFNVTYKLNYQFKDGRIRYDKPQIISMRKYQDGVDMILTFIKPKMPLGAIWIFNKKGEVRGLGVPQYKKDLEDLFNNLFNSYEGFIKNPLSTEEDW